MKKKKYLASILAFRNQSEKRGTAQPISAQGFEAGAMEIWNLTSFDVFSEVNIKYDLRGVFQFYSESINIFSKVKDRKKYVFKDFFLWI